MNDVLCVCVTCHSKPSFSHTATSSMAQFPQFLWCPVSLLVLRLSPRRCTGAYLQFMHWKMIWYLFCTSHALGAALWFCDSPGWYQISPVRLLLYQPCCPPAKQMTADLHTRCHLSLCDKWHISPSPIRLSSISYCCQGVDCYTNALTTAASREHGASRLQPQQFFGSEVVTFRMNSREISNRELNVDVCTDNCKGKFLLL